MALEFVNGYDEIRFCRWIAKATEAYFKQPSVQERYEAWLKEREKNAAGKAADESSEGACIGVGA